MKNKKALLGFVIVLVLTLTLAGLTFYKLAEIFGLHQTQKSLDSFHRFVKKVNGISEKPVGTKESMPLYVDKKSAIIGFSRNSNEVYVEVGLGGNDHISPRLGGCEGSDTCLCLCRNYDWDIRLWYGIDIQPVRCRGEFICYTFENFDFPSELTYEDMGIDSPAPGKFTGGFVLARTIISGAKEIKTRLSGVYITKETEGLVSVSLDVEGLSEEAKKKHTETEEARKLFNEGYNAYANKQWDLAIQKFDELIEKGIVEELSTGLADQVWLYRGMAYYHKGDRENAVKALDEGISFVSDDELRAFMRKKIEEIEAEG